MGGRRQTPRPERSRAEVRPGARPASTTTPHRRGGAAARVEAQRRSAELDKPIGHAREADDDGPRSAVRAHRAAAWRDSTARRRRRGLDAARRVDAYALQGQEHLKNWRGPTDGPDCRQTGRRTTRPSSRRVPHPQAQRAGCAPRRRRGGGGRARKLEAGRAHHGKRPPAGRPDASPPYGVPPPPKSVRHRHRPAAKRVPARPSPPSVAVDDELDWTEVQAKSAGARAETRAQGPAGRRHRSNPTPAGEGKATGHRASRRRCAGVQERDAWRGASRARPVAREGARPARLRRRCRAEISSPSASGGVREIQSARLRMSRRGRAALHANTGRATARAAPESRCLPSRRSACVTPTVTGLAFAAEWDARDEHEPALGARLQRAQRNLRLYSRTARRVVRQAQLAARREWTQLRGLGDGDARTLAAWHHRGIDREPKQRRASVGRRASASKLAAQHRRPRGDSRRSPARCACRDGAPARDRARPSRPRAGLPDSRTVGRSTPSLKVIMPLKEKMRDRHSGVPDASPEEKRWRTTTG